MVVCYNRSMAQMTNTQFAERTGYHHTSVSRLRNGHRLPSTSQLLRICEEFGLDVEKYLRAHSQGAEAFSAPLREEVMGDEDESWPGVRPEQAAGREGRPANRLIGAGLRGQRETDRGSRA